MQHHAGDTFMVSRPAGGYSSSDGWLLKGRLLPRSGSTTGTTVYTGTAQDDGGHALLVPAASTADWAPGDYTLVLWVEKSTDVYTLPPCQVQVLENLRTASTGVDTRSLAERTLAQLKQAFADWSATRGMQRRYKVNEREMEFNSSAEILAQIHYWEAEVAREREAARRRAGGAPRNRIKVTFTRPRY